MPTATELKEDFDEINTDWGESISVTVNGTPRTITAIVDRDMQSKRSRLQGQTSQQIQYKTEIIVRASEMTDILLYKKAVTFSFPLNIGEAVSTFQFGGIVNQDGGSVRIGLTI